LHRAYRKGWQIWT